MTDEKVVSDFELRRKCKELDRYNGYTNFETWATALWIDNDRDLYDNIEALAKEKVESAKTDANVKSGIWTPCAAAKFRLADEIKSKIEDANPIADKASLYADINEVDWDEIAEEHLVDKIVCKKGVK